MGNYNFLWKSENREKILTQNPSFIHTYLTISHVFSVAVTVHKRVMVNILLNESVMKQTIKYFATLQFFVGGFQYHYCTTFIHLTYVKLKLSDEYITIRWLYRDNDSLVACFMPSFRCLLKIPHDWSYQKLNRFWLSMGILLFVSLE